ncbi:N-acetyltransferase eso1 [Schizosaccharomyces pombe]
MELGKSKFSWKDLQYCDKAGTQNSPLRVVAHIDQDAFYAQVESVRLGLDHSVPLAVQQWQGLIAVNYAARAANISRHETVTEAKKKCPELCTAHVKTWKAGESEAKYHENPNPNYYKTCLDPYRHESVKILNIIKKHAPVVKKASIDECFIELTSDVKRIVLEEYPYLKIPSEDSNVALPQAPVLLWPAEFGMVIEEEVVDRTKEDYERDWDDVFLFYAAKIVKEIRDDIYLQLKYTCSAGVSFNPMLSKLVSSRNKPNKQTILTKNAIQDYLVSLKITDIRMLGGKFGEEIINLLGTDSIKDVWNMSMDFLIDKLGQTNGPLVWNLCHGIDNTEITTQVQIKSMLSAKNFSQQKVKSEEDAINWFQVFASDLRSRFLELEGMRRPKTICLTVVSRFLRKSRSSQIPMNVDISTQFIVEATSKLLRQLQQEFDVYPISNLSISFQNIIEVDRNSRGIEGFLKKSNDEIYMSTSVSPSIEGRAKLLNENMRENNSFELSLEKDIKSPKRLKRGKGIFDMLQQTAVSKPTENSADETYTCEECEQKITLSERNEHEDYHIALSISRKERYNNLVPPSHDKPKQVKPKTYGRKTGSKHYAPLSDETNNKRAFLDAFLGNGGNLTPSWKKQTPKAISNSSDNMTQLHLDLANSTVTCSECSMEYNSTSEEDILLHSRFHSRVLGGVTVSFQCSPIYRVNYGLSSDCIYSINSESSLIDQRKAEEALSFVNNELSSEPIETIGVDKYTTFLFISDKKCVGLLLAERISSAYIVDELELNSNNSTSSAVYIKNENLRKGFVLGVSRIWVSASRRKQGIASLLLDNALKKFIYGYVISPAEVAFSQPSESGKQFIISWHRSRNNGSSKSLRYAVYES